MPGRIACWTILISFVALIAANAIQAQQKYAFVVGVENYDPQFFRNLDYAEEDATDLAAQMETMGYETILMTASQQNPQHRPNTPEKILRLLDGQLKSVTKDDLLVISFSGHGIQFKEEKELASGGKETYFVPEEGSLSDKSTLLPIVKEIVSRVDACKAERKLVLIDACRNEVLSDAGDKSAGKIDLGSVHENLQVVPKGMTVVFSCSSGQKSWETDKLKHSVFSGYVLEYLSGKSGADYYTDQKADVSGLIEYVRRRTHQYVIKNITPSGQYPQVVGDIEQWPLGKVGPPEVYTTQFGHKMRLIPAGKFMMGSPEDELKRDKDEFQHEVELTRNYFMSAHEVSVSQFREFVTETSRDMPKQEWGYDIDNNQLAIGEYNWETPGWKQENDMPVVNVSWLDAVDYCKWLSTREGKTYRLPTEAEWEYACRAGTTGTYPFSKDEVTLNANVSQAYVELGSPDDFEFTAPIGQFKPNAFGLYDMNGNVGEWCMDFDSSDYFKNSPLTDPTGPADGTFRVIKGGSFNYGPENIRCATRHQSRSDNRMPFVGFRVVCEIEDN